MKLSSLSNGISLPDASHKSHWSITDSFGSGGLLKCFTHRDYRIGGHTHDFVEVNIVVQGKGLHYLGERSFMTGVGDVFVVPPGVRHGYRDCEALDVIHILIHPSFLISHAESLAFKTGYTMLFTVEPFYRAEVGLRHSLTLGEERLDSVSSLCEMLRLELGGEREDHHAGEALGLYILHLLCREYTRGHCELSKSGAQAAGIRQVLDFINANYTRKIILEELAEEAHLQKNYLCRVFRRVMGMTAMEYVNAVRVQAGRRLLLETTQSITGIALAVGFYDTAHFSRVFTTLTGLTPSRFRCAGT